MSEVALAFEPDVWASIVVNCDPEPHKWRGPVRARFAAMIDALRPAIERVTRDGAIERIETALRAMHAETVRFLECEPKFRTHIVQDLLDRSEFSDSYAAFLEAAAQARRAGKRPRPRPSARHLPVQHEELTQLSAFADELQRQLSSPQNAVPVSFDVVTPKAKQRRSLFWFVYDPLFPAEIADAILGRLESEAAFVLLRFAKNWAIEDLIALARYRNECLMRYARFRAGIPGTNIPLVPSEGRLDVPAIIARAEIGNAKFSGQAERAINEIKTK